MTASGEPSSPVQAVWEFLAARLTWRNCLLAAVPVVVLFPRQVVKMLSPFIRHFERHYERTRYQPTCIVLSSDQNITDSVLQRIHAEQPLQVRTVEIPFGDYPAELSQSVLSRSVLRPSEGSPLARVWAEHLLLKVRLNEAEAPCANLLVKAPEIVLRFFLLRFYAMPADELYKIEDITSKKLRVLLKTNRHYEKRVVDLP